jgi:predicted GIY-YIG superfamily endonuclease
MIHLRLETAPPPFSAINKEKRIKQYERTTKLEIKIEG